MNSDQALLLKNISKLPQFIQDIIGSYNVNHRKYMKIILTELYKKIHKISFLKVLKVIRYIECSCCDDPIYIDIEQEVVTYDYSGIKHYFCCYHCASDFYDMWREYQRYLMRQKRNNTNNINNINKTIKNA